MRKLPLLTPIIASLLLTGCINNQHIKKEYICHSNNDCVLKSAPYCCGENLEFVKRCFHKQEEPLAKDCTGNDMCPRIKKTLDCECRDNACIDIYDNNLPAIKTLLPNKKLCKPSETGWFCVFTDDNTIYKLNDRLQKLEKEFKQACFEQGGHWRCTGMCMPAYRRTCELPLGDGGTQCTNSEQCRGQCIVSKEFVKENYGFLSHEGVRCVDCKGKCSKYMLHYCGSWFELNDGIIKIGGGAICD